MEGEMSRALAGSLHLRRDENNLSSFGKVFDR